MSSLIVFRHGKSDWQAGDGDDRSRPLSRRGRRSAAAMGRFLACTGQVPELALTSPALRATETLRLAMEAGGWRGEVRTSEALYGGVGEVLAELRLLAPDVVAAMVVGHEPTSSDLIAVLIGGGRIRLPTGAMARIDLGPESWSDLEPGCGELAWLLSPRLAAEGIFTHGSDPSERSGSAKGHWRPPS
ncbi:MAG TPA: histidine phosphatase family protein [Acidimicrobiales bacterium]|nr:histidine phosphatase family protein [Acidimicrobiales bacterium]